MTGWSLGHASPFSLPVGEALILRLARDETMEDNNASPLKQYDDAEVNVIFPLEIMQLIAVVKGF